MDVERFVAELPGLSTTSRGSPHPRGPRFDDVLARSRTSPRRTCSRCSTSPASCSAPGESYVEVGVYYGASLIARDAREHAATSSRSTASVRPGRGRGAAASRPRAARGSRRTCAASAPSGATILEGDAFELLEGGALGDRRVGVYYYDGPHDYDSQCAGCSCVEPWLADEALLVVDDYDWEQVARATATTSPRQPRAERCSTIAGSERGAPQWWDGVAVLGWRRWRLRRRGPGLTPSTPSGRTSARPAQRLDDPRVGVAREVDVPVEVAADPDLVEVERPGSASARRRGAGPRGPCSA